MLRMKRKQEFQTCAEQLKAVADPDRLRIVDCLLDGELNVGEIAERLKIEMVNVSHHLKVLRYARIVQSTKRGRFVVYSLHPNIFVAPTGPEDTPQIEFGCCRISLHS